LRVAEIHLFSWFFTLLPGKYHFGLLSSLGEGSFPLSPILPSFYATLLLSKKIIIFRSFLVFRPLASQRDFFFDRLSVCGERSPLGHSRESWGKSFSLRKNQHRAVNSKVFFFFPYLVSRFSARSCIFPLPIVAHFIGMLSSAKEIVRPFFFSSNVSLLSWTLFLPMLLCFLFFSVIQKLSFN